MANLTKTKQLSASKLEERVPAFDVALFLRAKKVENGFCGRQKSRGISLFFTRRKGKYCYRLQRQVCELEKRVDKYFQNLENVEEMCEEAKAEIKRFQLKADESKEIVKRDAEVQAKLF